MYCKQYNSMSTIPMLGWDFFPVKTWFAAGYIQYDEVINNGKLLSIF
jgi:hypothetical protein